jgi:alpha-mannosidase
VPASRRTRGLQRLLSDINATYAADSGAAELVFLAELPPLGYSSYVLTPLPEGSSAAAEGAALGGGGPQPPAAAEVVIQHDAAPLASDETSNATAGEPEPHPVVVDNGAVTLRFCPRSGLLQSAALRGGPAVALTPQFFWYNASDGLEAQEDRGQSSGAYIFRPNGVYPLPQAPAGAQGGAGAAVGLEVVRGAVVTEVRQTFAPWATLVTRCALRFGCLSGLANWQTEGAQDFPFFCLCTSGGTERAGHAL